MTLQCVELEQEPRNWSSKVGQLRVSRLGTAATTAIVDFVDFEAEVINSRPMLSSQQVV